MSADSNEPLQVDQPLDVGRIEPDRVWANCPNWWLAEKFGFALSKFTAISLFLVVSSTVNFSALLALSPFIFEKTTDFTCVVTEEFRYRYRVIDRCTVVDLTTDALHSCYSLLSNVTSFHYNNSKERTVTSQFDLVCENENNIKYGQFWFPFGVALGAPIVSILADKFGRRKLFMFSMVMAAIFDGLTIIMPTFTLFNICRFAAGIFHGGTLNIYYMMPSEVVSPEMRNAIPKFTGVIWTFGMFEAGILWFLIDSWKPVYIICALPALTYVYYQRFSESLEYLISNGKNEEVLKIIRAAEEMNGQPINLEECLREVELVEERTGRGEGTTKWGSITFTCVIAIIPSFIMNMNYSVQSLNSTELHENKIVSFFMSAAAELPSGFLACWGLNKFNRRPFCGSMFFMAGLCFLIIVVAEGNVSEDTMKIIKLVCSLLAKTFNNTVWCVLPIAISEILPAPIRGTASGIITCLAEFGNVLAPFLDYWADIYGTKTVTSAIAALALVCWFLVQILPETKGKSMVAKMEDFDEGDFLRCLRRYWASFLRRFGRKQEKDVELAYLNEEENVEEEEQQTDSEVENEMQMSIYDNVNNGTEMIMREEETPFLCRELSNEEREMNDDHKKISLIETAL